MSKLYFPRGNADAHADHEPIATTEWTSIKKALAHFSLTKSAKNPFIFGKHCNEEGEEVLLSYDDDAGVLSVAGTRAGKGVSLISTNLLSHKGAAITLDLKGENAAISAEWRAKELGQNVAVFDPFGITKFTSASMNPLLYLDTNDKEFIDDITDFAEALIVRGSGNDPHWDESARSVIKMILIVVIKDYSTSRKNLATLRKLILKGQSKSEKRGYKPPVFVYDDELSEDENEEIRQEIHWEAEDDKQPSFYRLLQNIAEHGDDYVAGTAQRLLQAGDKERGSIISTVQRNTEFLDSVCIQDVLTKPDFDINELWNSSVYLVLPEHRLDGQSRWLRLMLTILLRHIQINRKPDKDAPSLLMVLDECAAIGHMPVIERAASYISGFGVRLWTIWQDLSQLKDIYPKRWETFIGNASLFTVFGNVDLTTQEYVSKRLGKCETARVEHSYTGGSSQNENRAGMDQVMKSALASIDTGGSQGETEGYSVKPTYVISPLLHPEEVGRYFGKGTGKILALFGQGQPVWAERIKYYEDVPFKSRAGANPMFE